jgi:iron-sulfur cluster repair protein YtfE (RIC family)
MTDTDKNNAPAAPADWFQHLDRMELDQAITQVVGRRHGDLRLLVDAVASTVAEVDAVECHNDMNWCTLRQAWSGFTERLGQHLSAENHTLLPHATGQAGPPTREVIRHIRQEHTQLLEDLDALAEAFEALKQANFCDAASAAKLALAADRFADLESALNAEIFAEEVGILRRCAALRNNAVATS